MYSDNKEKTARLEYSGEKFRLFLQRNDISYKEAAETLGMDKNTVGKAVRGGNLNIDMVLRICNCYGMDITDFFARRDHSKVDEINQYNGSEEIVAGDDIVRESIFKYKKCEILFADYEEMMEMLHSTKALLADVAVKYNHCCKLLNAVEDILVGKDKL